MICRPQAVLQSVRSSRRGQTVRLGRVPWARGGEQDAVDTVGLVVAEQIGKQHLQTRGTAEPDTVDLERGGLRTGLVQVGLLGP